MAQQKNVMAGILGNALAAAAKDQIVKDEKR